MRIQFYQVVALPAVSIGLFAMMQPGPGIGESNEIITSPCEKSFGEWVVTGPNAPDDDDDLGDCQKAIPSGDCFNEECIDLSDHYGHSNDVCGFKEGGGTNCSVTPYPTWVGGWKVDCDPDVDCQWAVVYDDTAGLIPITYDAFDPNGDPCP